MMWMLYLCVLSWRGTEWRTHEYDTTLRKSWVSFFCPFSQQGTEGESIHI
jgi:hypothetical protein